MADTVSSQFFAARIDCALQDRVIGQQEAAMRSRWFAFYVEAGHAHALTREGEYELSGPALIWGPLERDTRLKISAGSVGHYLFASDRVIGDAIGLVAEAAELRLFAQRHVMASFERADRRVPELDDVFQRLIAETGRSQFGTEIAVSAYVRLLLVLLWRSVDRDSAERETLGSGRAEISRFRNLVESHFRARWKSAQYADALGMSYDRLHDLCVRSVGKPPAQLVRERSFHESQILLQRTSLSAERIATMLGYGSASQFNHFFKAMAGETPGRFRKRMAKREPAPSETQQVGFSDWP